MNPPPLRSPGVQRRRRALLRSLPALALARLAPAAAATAVGGPAVRPLEAVELAPGAFVLPGFNAVPDAANLGRVGNLGFVVGRDAIAIVDTGSSHARAAEQLAAIRRVSRLPIRCAVITHPAQEFLFGTGFYTEHGIPVLAHPLTPRFMSQRCEHCLATLDHDVGPRRMAGTRLVLPRALDLPPAPVDLGGRELQLSAGPAGTVPGNLMVMDGRSGVLFTGALLSVRRIPGLQDTSPQAWTAALAALDDPAVRIAVPAWGPVAARQPPAGQATIDQAKAELSGYFAALEAQARQLYDQQVPLAELGEHAALPRFQGWNGYPATHVHNIFYRYLQLEAEDLASH